MSNTNKNFKMIQNHLKKSGFIFQNSEIYGGLANAYDYGPLGTLLLQNIKTLWWREYIATVPNHFGVDSKILLNPKVWETSGHVNKFVDLLIENKHTGKRYRADHLIQAHNKNLNVEAMSQVEMMHYIQNQIKKVDGKLAAWGPIRDFNLMYKTYQGVVEENKKPIYLRPETAQGIFINFGNIERSMRAKLPFGIGQIGRSFRNEVTPGNYIFRTREFEQMELEYFVTKNESRKSYHEHLNKAMNFLIQLGLKKDSLRKHEHAPAELAHYAKASTDIEFHFPFGWGELMGVANRGDFDLKNHAFKSGVKLDALDPKTNKRVVPYVIEPSFGLDRLALALLVNGYETEQTDKETRTILKLNSAVAPYQIAILPLNKNVHSEAAKEVYAKLLKKDLRCVYDESGSIGRRYRRQDAMGTPLCLTVIDETKTQNKATIRFRDNMKQIEIEIDHLNDYL